MFHLFEQMTAALGSLEFVIPCHGYYILIKVCHFRCVSIIMLCQDSLPCHKYCRWFTSHVYVKERC